MSGVEYGLKQNSPTGKRLFIVWEGGNSEREKRGKKRKTKVSVKVIKDKDALWFSE